MHTPKRLWPPWGAVELRSLWTAGCSFVSWCLRAHESKVLINPVPLLDYRVRHLSKRGMWVLKRSEGRERRQPRTNRSDYTDSEDMHFLCFANLVSVTLISLNWPVTSSHLCSEAEITCFFRSTLSTTHIKAPLVPVIRARRCAWYAWSICQE